jgi:hypothetical protein
VYGDQGLLVHAFASQIHHLFCTCTCAELQFLSVPVAMIHVVEFKLIGQIILIKSVLNLLCFDLPNVNKCFQYCLSYKMLKFVYWASIFVCG